MRHRFLLPLLLITIFEFSPYGSADVSAQYKYNLSQFGHESWSFIKQPAKWQAGDWLKVGLAGAGTFLVMQADQPVRDAVLRDHRYSMSIPIEGGRMWGELYTPVILFSGFALHSIIADDMTTRKIGFEIGQASIYGGLLTQIMKIALGRARPYTNDGSKEFHPFSTFSFNKDYQALPSGHAAIALILSTVLSRNVKPGWLKGVAYIPAALTLVSRVYQDRHWASDEFLGAILGYCVATWVVDQHENDKSPVEISSSFPLSIRIAF